MAQRNGRGNVRSLKEAADRRTARTRTKKKKPTIAEQEQEVDKVLRSYEFFECRAEAHSWRKPRLNSIESALEMVGPGLLQSIRICGECGTTRYRTVDLRTGEAQNTYSYPDGYTMRGLGRVRPEPRAWRVSYYTSAIKDVRAGAR